MKYFTKVSAYIFSAVFLVIGILGLIQLPAYAANFTDTNGHWAKSYIDQIAEKGIVQGKTPGHYAPDDNVSRAELLKIALNAFEYAVDSEVTEDVLSDVKRDDWFAPYVRTAFRNNIIYGFNDGFGPNSPATRGMAITILVKAAGYEDVDTHFAENYTAINGMITANFPDVPVAAYFAPYIAYLYDLQIIDGYEDGTFGPGNPITRAEIAKIVVNMIDEAAPTETMEGQGLVEKETWELTGTYYRMSSRGSALYFRTDSEPDKEIHLQNPEILFNDKQLYEDLGLKEIYEVKDPGCSSFWGNATIRVTNPQLPSDDGSELGALSFVEKDGPFCGPAEFQVKDHPALSCGSATVNNGGDYNPDDSDYAICYDEAYSVYTDDNCYLMIVEPIEDEYYSLGYHTYDLLGEEIGGEGKSSGNMTIDYEKCLPTTEEYFNSIVE